MRARRARAIRVSSSAASEVYKGQISDIIKTNGELIQIMEKQTAKAESAEAAASLPIADQLWNIVPAKLRNLFLVVVIFGGGSLGDMSIMVPINGGSDPGQVKHNAATTEVLTLIHTSQQTMITNQEVFKYTIKDMKADVSEIKADVSENRKDIKGLLRER